MNEVATFLSRFAPFDSLPAEQLEQLGDGASLVEYAAGEAALIEDGAPATVLYVVRTGSMELVHEEQVIDVLEPGEPFGHPSLLTGLAPAFTVRAHETSASCLLLTADAARIALARESGARFIARSLRERMVRTGIAVHGLPELHRTRMGALVRRPPLVFDPSATVGEVARQMTETGAQAALVRTADGADIVTDADLRSLVLAAGGGSDDRIERAMRRPLAVPADRLAGEAVVDMLAAGVNDVCVRDRAGAIIGIVSSEELLGSQGSPFMLRRALAQATEVEAIVSISSELPRLFLALIDNGLGADEIGATLSLFSDAVTGRLIDFAFERHGPAPTAWAWMALGSVARRELTLASDQDNAFAYADTGDETAVDGYFERLTRDVNAGLTRCGFGPDKADVLAGNRLWRMPLGTWIQVFEDCLERPDHSHLVRAAISFDFRHVAGGLEIVEPLIDRVQRAPAYPEFIRRLGRSALTPKPPLGFRGGLALGRDEAGSGHLDIKRGGVLPVANLARFFAIRSGITISGTLDRFTAAEAAGGLDRAVAESLREAFSIISRLRLELHAAQIRTGKPLDNLLDPHTLPPLVRTELRECFRAVAAAQKSLGVYAPMSR